MRSTSPDRPEHLLRLDEVTAALAGLRTKIAEEEPLPVVLQRLAETAVKGIADADAVSVTLLEEGGPLTAAATEQLVADVDAAQYSAGRGPVLLCAQARQPVRTTTDDGDDRWPEFVRTARANGIQALLSVPLLLEGASESEDELLGSLNVHSRTASAFDPFDERLMELFSGAAAAAIGNARRWHHARQRVRHLEIALTSRAEIDQAKGVLMAVHGLTADEAFARLVEQSQRQNTKLREVAHALLESVRRR